MSLSTKLLSMLLIRAAVNAYRKLKLSITISEYSTTQRSLCGKGKRYSTQHTIPQNLNLKNILTKPSHLLVLQRFYFSETVSKTGFYHARHFQSRRLSVNGMISLPALPCLKNTLFMESYSRLHDTNHTILPW